MFGGSHRKKKSKQKLSVVEAPDVVALRSMEGLIARDGSFGRARMKLSEFRQFAYGRPFSTEIVFMNEWTIEPQERDPSYIDKAL